jgi:hypothetical protein
LACHAETRAGKKKAEKDEKHQAVRDEENNKRRKRTDSRAHLTSANNGDVLRAR